MKYVKGDIVWIKNSPNRALIGTTAIVAESVVVNNIPCCVLKNKACDYIGTYSVSDIAFIPTQKIPKFKIGDKFLLNHEKFSRDFIGTDEGVITAIASNITDRSLVYYITITKQNSYSKYYDFYFEKEIKLGSTCLLGKTLAIEESRLEQANVREYITIK